ncbi:MAG: DUF2304 domain-containing protein [Lachnospiraceae bacterium]|nr:DUF2304 domain-containing protein [Lachnospiraceae bacterium]
MSNALRVLLLVGALAMLVYIIKSIRKSKVQMKDAFTWIVIAVMIAIFGVFPQIPMFIAWGLGIESTANMVFLIFIAILLLRIFSLSMKVSLLEDKLVTMAGETAIRTKESQDKLSDDNKGEDI